nr:uncharacterized protein LOC111134527 isoform X6 [Crassostrea virginica]
MENNVRSSVDSGAMNQTGSTNDSHHVDSSQASPVRGLSSDEGSGWKSETTETSDGNLSLSQYAIGGDQSEDDSPHHSAPEEFLTSAISEVSKDFISGNFSPSKYPGGSGESDSLSDGDHPGHVSGAVYARYPESATGMSDCEWNPYATESDNNYTPRSNVSDSAPTSVPITTTAPMKDPETTSKEDKLDEIYAQQLSRNAPGQSRLSPSSPSATDSGNGSVKSSYREEEVSHHQPWASYVLYPPDVKLAPPQGKVASREKRSAPSEQLSAGIYKGSDSRTVSAQKFDSRPNPLGSSTDECLYAKRTYPEIPDTTDVSQAMKQGNSGEYLPVDERDKLLSNLQRENSGQKRLSDPVSGTKEDVPSNSKERLSDGGLSKNGEENDLSQRVARLLNSANELGSSLHQTLYNKETLGLDDRENFPKYRFSPVRSQFGLSTPSPTLGTSGQDDLTRSAKSMTSDVSLRSSLGEEVAKLLSRTDNISGMKPDEDISAASEPSSKTFKPIPTETQSGTGTEAGKKTEEAVVTTGCVERQEAEDRQKIHDSLDRKVKEILQRTAYVENKQVPRKAEAPALDYSLLQRDLQEIQNSLPVHLNADTSMDASGEKEGLRDSLKMSEKSFVSETESRNGGKKLLWDHGADLGYDDSCRFLGTMKSDTETMEASQGSLDKSFESSGKSSQASKDGTEKAGDMSDVVSDQLEVEIDEIRISHVAPDVEEIIAKYQKKEGPPSLEPQYEEDTSGLASRVFSLLTAEHPQKQASGILETVVKAERELIQKMVDPRLDSSYDGFDLRSADNSFAPKDRDIRKQLEWSQMSSLDYGHADKTALSEMSFKTGLPFSALGNAKTFLSSQLQKMSDQTFNHSIELKTPYRNVLECYTVYGAERNPTGASKEAWQSADQQGRYSQSEKGRQTQDQPWELDRLSNQRFFLNSLDTTPAELRPRRYSDPRELSPEGRGYRDGHNRSKSEDDKSFIPDHDLLYGRNGSQPLTSTSGEGGARPKISGQKSERGLDGTPPAGISRRMSYKSNRRDSSPRSGGMSPGDSDLSSSSMSRRREGPKLRPYRPPGSREVYYTETDDSVADSVTTMESTHTGSDDAVGPYVPSHHLGTRPDGLKSSGIYGNKSGTVHEDELSTIEEKSVLDERERRGTVNPSSEFMRDSGLEHSIGVSMATDRVPSGGSDRLNNKVDYSRGFDSSSNRNLTNSAGVRPGSSDDSLQGDSKLSMTSRSDPGDQFATPRRVRDVSKFSQAHLTEDDSSGNLVKSKSRSETDLVTLSPEGKQVSSSPVARGRPMDMSAQPSPIPSQHSTLLSPSFQGALGEMQQRNRLQQQDNWSRSGETDRERADPYSRADNLRSERSNIPKRTQEDEIQRSGVVGRRPQEGMSRGYEYGRVSPEDDDVRWRRRDEEERGDVEKERRESGRSREDFLGRDQEEQGYVRSRPLDEEIYDYAKKHDNSDRATPNQYDRLGDLMSQYQNRPLDPSRESLNYDSQPSGAGRTEYSSGQALQPNRANPDSRTGRQEASSYSRFVEDHNIRSDDRLGMDERRFYPQKDYDAPYGQRSTDIRPLEPGSSINMPPRESGFYSGQSGSDREYNRTDFSQGPSQASLGSGVGEETRRTSPISGIGGETSHTSVNQPMRSPEENMRYRIDREESSGIGVETRRLSPVSGIGGETSRTSLSQPMRSSEENIQFRYNREESRPLEPGRGSEVRPLERGALYPGESLSHPQKSDLDLYKPSLTDLEADKRRQRVSPDQGLTQRERSGEDMQQYIERERGRPLDRGQDYLDMFIPKAIDRDTRERERSRDRESQLSRSGERSHRSRSPANRSSERELRQFLVDGEVFTELPQVPDDEFEDMLRTERLKAKKELEMMRQLKRPKGGVLTEEEEKTLGAEFDSIPPSKKAQALRETLEKDRDPALPANINELWRKFQEMNETHSDSSMNTSRIESLTSLLKNPTRHSVQRALDDRTYQKARERRVVQGLVGDQAETGNQHKDQRRSEKQKRRETLSEEEVNGSYAEILAKQKKMVETEKKQKNKENKKKGNKQLRIQEVKKLGDSADTLYSIPEDTSFESSRGASPNVVTESQRKSKRNRQKNIIDPLMVKLREKVERQKNKIDVERRKEMKRMEKLQKLEMLLGAKKKGKLSDRAISAELENVSTTSVPQSDDSTTFLNSDSTLMEDSDQGLGLDSTSSKDSSIELQRTRTRKSKDNREFQKSSLSTIPLDDSESQSDIIIIRKPKSKERKDRMNEEEGHKSRSHKKPREDRGQINRDKNKSSAREKFHLETSPVRSQSQRDIGTMYPSPIEVSPPRVRRRPKEVAMKSEAVQTAGRSLSPSYSQTRVIPVPLMSPESQRKTGSSRPAKRGPSPKSSPNRSNIFPQEYTPPRSKSPPSKVGREVGKVRNRITSPPKNKMFIPESDSEYEKFVMKTPPKNKMFTPETPDDEYTAKMRDSPKGLAWYIPMGKEARPWKKPLKERQAHAVRSEPWQPSNISSNQWKHISNKNVMNKSRDTHFDLNPSGELIENKENTMEESDDDDLDTKPLNKMSLQVITKPLNKMSLQVITKPLNKMSLQVITKPLNKMSLQDAFKLYKQSTISHVRERQKRVLLAANERKLSTALQAEREQLFSENKKKEPNPDAHPYSENLHVPKKRSLTKEEIKKRTEKSYKKLAEVVQKKKEEKRQEDYALNRLKAKVFNRRIQNHVLKKSSTFR